MDIKTVIRWIDDAHSALVAEFCCSKEEEKERDAEVEEIKRFLKSLMRRPDNTRL